MAAQRAAVAVVVFNLVLAACTVREYRAPAAVPVSGPAPERAGLHARPTLPSAAAPAGEVIPHAPGRYFYATAFREDALAGRHEHALVQLVDIPVFVIRDEDVFKTPADRSTAIARVLQEALHAGDRFFIIGADDGLPAIYSVSHHGGYPRLLLRVTRTDAVAYARRSDRDVDEHVLAQWWLALLKDLLQVVFLNQDPQFTQTEASIEALRALRAELWDGQRAPTSSERIAAASAALPGQLRDTLLTLAFRVPQDFAPEPQDAVSQAIRSEPPRRLAHCRADESGLF